MDESKFCSACGRTLEPGMQFCPQCGKVVSGSASDKDMKQQEKEFIATMNEGRRMWLVFIVGIYAIPALILGIFALLDAGNIANMIWSDTEFQKWITTHGYKYTLSDIQNYVTYATALMTASGACALGTMVLLYLRKMWIAAVILCFIAAFLCFWSIFGVILGIFVAWTIFESRDVFEDAPPSGPDDS